MQGTAKTDDPFKLKTIISEQQKGIILLRAQHRLLCHLCFGATSEKISTNQLPLFNTELDLFEQEKTYHCCNGLLTRIGEESTKQVEYIPTSVKAKDYVGCKYICKHFKGKHASLPKQLPKSFTTTSLIAYLIVSKYRAIG